VLQKRLEGVEFALATGQPAPIPEGQPPVSGRPEIGAPDLAPLLLRGDTVIVIRMPPIDLPPHEYMAIMRKVRTDTLAWLAQERVHHSGVLILAPGWDLSAVPRADLRVLLDGASAARADRIAEAVWDEILPHPEQRMTWDRMCIEEPMAAEVFAQRIGAVLAKTDGEHVCALEGGA
jgi:hypothetical protein